MPKPSPQQARFLKLVTSKDASVFVRGPRTRPYFEVVGAYGAEDDYKVATVLACHKLGWLDKVPDEEARQTKGVYSFEPERGHVLLKISEAGRSTLATLVDADFVSPVREGPGDGAKTTEIIKALRQKHPMDFKGGYPPEWVALAEVNVSTGFSPQRIDFWALNCYPSRMESIGYEVKVSRGDWLKELARPEKRKMAMAVCNSFYFVAPKGLIKQAELPEGCGLLEWNGAKLLLNQPAPKRAASEPSWRFVASVARHAFQMGAKQ